MTSAPATAIFFTALPATKLLPVFGSTSAASRAVTSASVIAMGDSLDAVGKRPGNAQV